MVFKKKNDLKKKAKKKAKTRNKENKSDGWSHEGGVTIENSDDKNEIKKKRYHSQENDEKMRRSRLKGHHIKLQKDFVKKMSNKVKFSDILNNYKKDNDESEEEQGQKKRQRIEPPPPNRKPVLDRLNKMLNKTDDSDSDASEVEKNSDDELLENAEESNSEDDSAAETDDEELKPVFSAQRGALHQNKEEMNREVDEEEDADSDSEATKKNTTSFFDSFFHPSASVQAKIGEEPERVRKNKKVKEIYNPVTKNNDHLYAALEQTSLAGQYFNADKDWNISNLSDLGDLNRLWKNNSSKLNGFASTMLPCLSSYGDVFIEGMDYRNEAVISEACVMHMLFHVVKSRTKVVKHNKKLKAKAKLAALRLKGEVVISDDEDEGKNKPATAASTSTQPAASLSDDLVPTSSRSTRKAKRRELRSTEPAPLPTTTTRTRLDHSEDEKEEAEDHLRDQGFTRPRILILCPYRKSAAQIINTIFNVLGPNTSIANLEKFEEEFADPESDDESDSEYYAQFSSKKQKNFMKRNKKTPKPVDWEHIFKGNMDDDFKMGLQVNPLQGKGNGANKGVFLKLFTDFYLSDIIVASPLGLKLALEKDMGKSGAADFLTSIEQVYMHQSDVLYMQNWQHVEFIFEHLNLMPQTLGFGKKDDKKDGKGIKDITGTSTSSIVSTDFSRVRDYFLHNKAKYFRQMIFTSSFLTPDMLAFLRTNSTNHLGNFRLKKTGLRDGELGSIRQLYTIKQVFQKLPEPHLFLKNSSESRQKNSDSVQEKLVNNLLSYEEVRFKYFTDVILKKLLLLNEKHILLFVPSYFDFVRVRNELMKQEVSAVFISEYSRDSEISRGRARFFQGLKNILVYSGRSHFFRRFPIRGASQIIFYSPPEYAHFYPEMLNLLAPPPRKEERMLDDDAVAEEDENEYTSTLSSLCLFADHDMMSLSRIVGSTRAKQMIESSKDSFVFA